MRSALASFIDHFLPVRVRLRENFLVPLLGLGKFLLDSFRIELALLDFPPALLQHCKDRFVSEALQKVCNDADTNHLVQKQVRTATETISGNWKLFHYKVSIFWIVG